MLVRDVETKEGSLELIKDLILNEDLKVYGVFYDNSFFSQRYLCRSHLLNKVAVDEENKEVKLTIATRLENVGLLEIENTLDMLVRHEAGDIPGFMPEGILDNGEAVEPEIPEVISATTFLTTLDLLLILREPTVTYQDFEIAGTQFTMVNIYNKLDKDFDQTVSILFAIRGKYSLLSHFVDKELTTQDAHRILDLIVDANITGKAIIAVRGETKQSQFNLNPHGELINSYRNISGDIIVGNGFGNIVIPRGEIDLHKMDVTVLNGAYRIDLTGVYDKIKIYFEK